MRRVLLVALLTTCFASFACKKRPVEPTPLPPPPASAPASVEPEEGPVPEAVSPEPPPPPEPPSPERTPLDHADWLYRAGELLAAENAYQAILASRPKPAERERILLRLAMIYSDPALSIYDPARALETLQAIQEPTTECGVHAATLARLLGRLLEVEADRRTIRRSLQQVQQELEKLKEIDKRRTRRP